MPIFKDLMMNKRILYLALVVLIISAGFLVWRFTAGAEEDNWLCVDRQWVKHGNPSGPPPASGCLIAEDQLKPNANPTIEPTLAQEINFAKNGNITKSEEQWNLVYEEPGSPAITTALVFNKFSICMSGSLTIKCDDDGLQTGDRVEVQGIKDEISVNVLKLNVIKQNNANSLPEDAEIIKGISEAFAEKYKRSVDSFELTVSEKDATHAKGMVRFKDESGGALWFGALTDNKWVLAFDGQGIIDCNIVEKYGFSSKMISGCVDAENGDEFRQR